MLNTIFWKSVLSVGVAVICVILILPTPAPIANTTPDFDTSDNSFILRNAIIFDGEKVLEANSIIVENGIVSQVGSNLNNDTLRSIDAEGKWLIPGLIDAHTHNFNSAARNALNFGITTQIDMFTAAKLIGDAKRKRESTEYTEQSDAFNAGVLATAPNGHGTQFGVTVDTLSSAADASAWVARRQSEGSDFIKLVFMPNNPRFSSLDLPTARAVIRAAHERGLIAVAHTDTLDDAQAMIEVGINGLVHIFSDQPVTQAFIELAQHHSIFIVPTLSVIASADQQDLATELGSDPAIKAYLSETQRQQLRASYGQHKIDGFYFDLALQNIERLHESGIPILAGSDAPNPGTTHGASLHQELALLVRAGLSPQQALTAASSMVASAFGLEGRGRIAAGQRADLLLLDSSPIDNIYATRSLAIVIKNGFVVTRQKASQTTVSSKIDAPALSQFTRHLLGPSFMRWSITDDRMAGGNSHTNLQRHHGALTVQAYVESGFIFPWSGVGLFGEQAVDISDYSELVFDAKGTSGDYQTMTFSSVRMGAPPSQAFRLTQDWQTIRLSLSEFRGLNTKQLMGIAIVAGPAIGAYEYSLKNVTLQ